MISPRLDDAKADIAEQLHRPPWHVCSTREIADAMGVSFGRLGNWVVRGQFVPPAPRRLFRLTGNKQVYWIHTVAEWLTGVPAEDQAHRYLVSLYLGREGYPIWDHVRMLEGMNLWRHKWPPRDRDAYLATLGT